MTYERAILTTTTSFGKAAPGLTERLRSQGFQVFHNPFARKLTAAELEKLLKEHRPVGLLAGTEPITRPVMERARCFLKVISRVGVGWDNLDHDAAACLGIRVYRTGGVLTHAVAELTVGLMLAGLRLIPVCHQLIRQGLWHKPMGGLLHDKTLGLVGFGDIGRRVGELVHAFGCRIIYYDPQPVSVPWAQAVSLAELMGQADIISIHASGRETVLGANELARIGKRAIILVNTARGGSVDEEALCQALTDGRVGLACLDVFENEPYVGPLASLDNVILTPHIGSYAREARQLMEETAVDNLLQGLREVGAL